MREEEMPVSHMLMQRSPEGEGQLIWVGSSLIIDYLHVRRSWVRRGRRQESRARRHLVSFIVETKREMTLTVTDGKSHPMNFMLIWKKATLFPS